MLLTQKMDVTNIVTFIRFFFHDFSPLFVENIISCIRIIFFFISIFVFWHIYEIFGQFWNFFFYDGQIIKFLKIFHQDISRKYFFWWRTFFVLVFFLLMKYLVTFSKVLLLWRSNLKIFKLFLEFLTKTTVSNVCRKYYF